MTAADYSQSDRTRRVYFIRPAGMDGPVKVGSSMSPDNRLATLDTWSPFALEIVAEIAGDRDLEWRFHAYFEASHQRREWFHGSRQMDETIAAIQAGTFDPSVLPEPKNICHHVNGKRPKRTPEQCLQHSYALRVYHTERKTRRHCPVEIYQMVERGDRDAIAKTDAFLADPYTHGVKWEDRPGHEHRMRA